ncbi:lysophospholipid acyltransferase family protein, partial [Staphylococcus aureus]
VHTLHGALVVHGQFRFLNQEQRWQKVQWWGEKQLRMLGVKLVVEGTPRPGAKLLVANHISWLDIMAMHAVLPARFISKSEVASWPVVGA